MKYIRFTQSIEEVDIFIPKNLISSMDKRPNVVANDWFYFESSWKGNVISYRISIKNEEQVAIPMCTKHTFIGWILECHWGQADLHK